MNNISEPCILNKSSRCLLSTQELYSTMRYSLASSNSSQQSILVKRAPSLARNRLFRPRDCRSTLSNLRLFLVDYVEFLSSSLPELHVVVWIQFGVQQDTNEHDRFAGVRTENKQTIDTYSRSKKRAVCNYGINSNECLGLHLNYLLTRSSGILHHHLFVQWFQYHPPLPRHSLLKQISARALPIQNTLPHSHPRTVRPRNTVDEKDGQL